MGKHDFKYFFHEGLSNMFSHGFMSFAAIGITVACLLIMGTFTLVAVNANELLADLEQENEIGVKRRKGSQQPTQRAHGGNRKEYRAQPPAAPPLEFPLHAFYFPIRCRAVSQEKVQSTPAGEELHSHTVV